MHMAFDLETKEVTIYEGDDGGVEEAANGWFRVWTTGQLSSTGTMRFTIGAGVDSYTTSQVGDGYSGMYIHAACVSITPVNDTYLGDVLMLPYRKTEGFNVKETFFYAYPIYPEYSIKDKGIKIEENVRATGGNGYEFLWGTHRKLDLPVKYAPNEYGIAINLFWETNKEVVLSMQYTAEAPIMKLVGKTLPFGEYSKPYFDKMNGRLLLEEV